MPNDWKEVLVLTAEMMLEMGRNNPLKMEDYNSIQQPVLLLLGDRDKMVTMEETLSVYRLLPNAQLGVLPGTPHPIEQVDIALLAHLAARFLKG
jgi:pimeloyl-ACP methyl ester carboxylesterase